MEHKVGETVTFANHTITIRSLERKEFLVIKVALHNTSEEFIKAVSSSLLFADADSEGSWLKHHEEIWPAAPYARVEEGMV